jgi:hypothetical protein
MAELGIGAALLASSAGASAYYATGKTDLSLTINNQLQDARLTSPILFIDGGKRIEDPTPEIAPQTSMTAKFKKKTTSNELKGALIYELQGVSSDYRFYVLVAWRASCHRSTRIYTRLLFDQVDTTCDAGRLKDIYQRLSHQLVKTHDDDLIQSYTFRNGLGISLKSHTSGKKHRELHLTITNSVSQEHGTQPLWIGASIEVQDVEKRSIIEKTVKAFETMMTTMENIERLQQMAALGLAAERLASMLSSMDSILPR